MKKKIDWLPAAKDDLKQLHSYYFEYAGPSIATSMMLYIQDSVTLLSDMPYIGAPSRGNKNVFERHLKDYSLTIPYMVDGKFLIILRVFHQAQERPRHWRKK